MTSDQNIQKDLRHAPASGETPPVPLPAPRPQKAELRAGAAVRGLVPQTIEEAARLAEGIYRSGMTPDTYKVEVRDEQGNQVTDQQATQARLLIGILKGMEVGLPPITAISNIVVVNNRPSIWGDAALGLVQNSVYYVSHDEKLDGKEKTDDWKATCTITRKSADGSQQFIVSRTFTWAQAKAAGLTSRKGPWTSYPARMMQMRARAWAIRDGFADVLSGLSIAEEVKDIEVPVAQAPAPSVQQDKWSQAAIENKTDAPVDFSALGTKQPEALPVASAADQASPEEAAKEEVKPVCATCSGRGVVETEEGKEPCKDCN